MKFGFMTMADPNGIRPDVFARELEQRGFESVWLPEHTNIPTSRRTPYPGGGELPGSYYTTMNPFVTGMAMAAATVRLTIGTGVCLLLQHELIDLAKTVATLDVLSAGRVLFGVGVGWNEEELANVRPDLAFTARYAAMEERVVALRKIWAEDTPSFQGRWDRFEAATIDPKPVRRSVPIALGNAGRLGIGHAARYADAWCPIDASILNESGRPDVRGGIELFRRLATDAGRDADAIPVTLFCWSTPTAKRLDQYQQAGVQRIVAPPATMESHDEATTLRHLDSWQGLLEQFS